ncbi:MAG: hypothetical protein DDT32_01909 [Syntrophomonadaceae bacterium]|nr:hypothetical protein [Bacillota bacterium]
MIYRKQYPRVIYGVSSDARDVRAVAFEGDATWRVAEVEGLFYRPLVNRPEEDARWDALLDHIED